jgi:hypothetical protein
MRQCSMFFASSWLRVPAELSDIPSLRDARSPTEWPISDVASRQRAIALDRPAA